MKAQLMGLIFGAALLQGTALAAPPAPLKVVQSVEIKAPVDKVWATIKDFDSLNKWHPGFAKDEIVSGGDNKIGTVRRLTIKDGPSFTEQLLALDGAKHTMRYKIVESPLPITHYVSRISLHAQANGTTKVVWAGNFKRKNPADSPPEAESDAGATKLVTGVYRGGLDNLKKMLEGG